MLEDNLEKEKESTKTSLLTQIIESNQLNTRPHSQRDTVELQQGDTNPSIHEYLDAEHTRNPKRITIFTQSPIKQLHIHVQPNMHLQRSRGRQKRVPFTQANCVESCAIY